MKAKTKWAEQFPQFTVCDHPLIAHKLGLLRDSDSSITRFRELTREIGVYLGYEATRDLDLEEVTVKLSLPQLNADGKSDTMEHPVPRLHGPKPVLRPVMRSGLTLAEGVMQAIPFARIGHFGFESSASRTETYEYFYAIPRSMGTKTGDLQRKFYVVDVAIATGSVAMRSIELLREQDIHEENIRLIVLIACPIGLQRVLASYPRIRILAAAVDEEIRNGLAWPGIGSNNIRLFGV
jgi:uracil phosphoribosyltransferase